MLKKQSDKKYSCRYKCGASYKTISGRRYHEIAEHGKLWRKSEQTGQKPDESTKSTEKEVSVNEFISINEVKFMVAKKVNEKTTAEEYECGKCGEKFSELKKFCPNCGCEFE